MVSLQRFAYLFIFCWLDHVCQAFVTSRSFEEKTSYTSLLATTPTTTTLAEEFCDVFSDSLKSQSFIGFTLHGPRAPQDPTEVRGRLKRVQGRRVELKKKKRPCVQVTFKFHGATDVAKNYDDDKVLEEVVRPLMDGESVVNTEWGPSVDAPIGTDQFASLQGARLETTVKNWEYQATYGKKQRLISRKNTKANTASKTLEHDRVKQRPLSPTDAVLPALGLTTADGRPKPGKKAKLTQAQKFVEIVSRLIDQQVEKSRKICIYDMGCGRGYLTFSLHAHLLQNGSKSSVNTFGIDVRPKLVNDMNILSNSLGFESLKFLQGTIEEYMLVNNEYDETKTDADSLKVWLALHACDTATDDALWSGIVQKADIIVVAPCCHKELRPQLDRSMPVPDVLRHGIFRQRWAATLTDSIRVMLLELVGYQVQVLEFVQTADTPQNVMITAVKKRAEPENENETKQRLLDLAKSYGVEQQALARWMGISLGGDESSSGKRINGSQMPPL